MQIKNKILTIAGACFFCLCSITSQSQNKTKSNFKLSCFIKGSSGKLIILTNKPASGIDESFKIEHLDSCYSIKDSFQFEFYLNQPEWYAIEIKGDKQWKSFVAVPGGNAIITGKSDSVYKSTITGSKEDSIYIALTKGLLFPLYKAMSKAPHDSFKIYPDLIKKAKYEFIQQNPGSFVVAKYLVEANSYNRINDSDELSYLQKCYSALSPEAKRYTCSQNAYYNLFVANKRLQSGKKIPDFKLVNYNGNSFDLYGYINKEKKKYYLIDFWATWCAPCIAQLPKLKLIYDQFRNKGFQIIGYSLDIHKDKLENFLSNQKLEWKNITDLKGDQSLVYKMFKLGTIPSNYLIDQNGIIIGASITPDNISGILNEKLLTPTDK